MPAIKIPKTPARAFDKSRPVSSLLKSQIQQLQVAILESIETEGDAAEHIRLLTRQLHTTHPHTVPRAHGVRRSSRRKKAKRAAKKTTRAARRSR